MEELRWVVAGVYQRKGRDVLTRTEFKHAISLDLGWCPPADARRFLEDAISSGALSELGEGLRPTFDIHAIELPVGWRPGVRDAGGDLRGSFVDRVFLRLEGRIPRDRFDSEMRQVETRASGLLLPAAAALVVFAEHAVPPADLLEEARREILKREGSER